MTTSKVYEYDIGTEIKLDAGTDLTGYQILEIHYLKEDGTEGIWSASHVETTKARYITASGDITPNGKWKLKIFVVMSGGDQWFGNTVEMPVYDKWS